MFANEKTQIHLKSGKLVDTTNPIIYSGNFLLVTQKRTQILGETAVLSSEITPYHLDTVLNITTSQLTKTYPQYEEQR